MNAIDWPATILVTVLAVGFIWAIVLIIQNETTLLESRLARAKRVEELRLEELRLEERTAQWEERTAQWEEQRMSQYNITYVLDDDFDEQLLLASGVSVKTLDNAFLSLYQHGHLDNYRGNKQAKQFVHELNQLFMQITTPLDIKNRYETEQWLEQPEVDSLLASMQFKAKPIKITPIMVKPEKDLVLDRLQRVSKLEED